MSAYIKQKSDGAIMHSCSLQTVTNPEHLKSCQDFLTSRGMSLHDFIIADATEAEIQAMVNAYTEASASYAEKRLKKYPKIEELVVALYDTDDKAAIEKRRSDVKQRFPKP